MLGSAAVCPIRHPKAGPLSGMHTAESGGHNTLEYWFPVSGFPSCEPPAVSIGPSVACTLQEQDKAPLEGLPEKLKQEKGSLQGSPKRSDDESCHSSPESGGPPCPSTSGSPDGPSLSFFPPKPDIQDEEYWDTSSDLHTLSEGTGPCQEDSQGKEALGVSSSELLQALCRLVLGEGSSVQQQETATEASPFTTPAATTGSGRGSVCSIISASSANACGPKPPSKNPSPDPWGDRCGESPEQSPFSNGRICRHLQPDHQQEHHSLRVENHFEQFGGPAAADLHQQRPNLWKKGALSNTPIGREPLYETADSPSPLLQQLHPRQRHIRAQPAFAVQQNDPWALSPPLGASCSRLPNRQPQQQQHFALHDRRSFARRWPRAAPPPAAMRGLNRGAPQRPPPSGDVRGGPVVLGSPGSSRPPQASNLRALLACYVQLVLQQQHQNRMGQQQNRHRGSRGSRGSRGAARVGQGTPALQQRRRQYDGPPHVSPQQQSHHQRLPFAAPAEQIPGRAFHLEPLLAAFRLGEDNAEGPQLLSGVPQASLSVSTSVGSSDSSHAAAFARLVQPDGGINLEAVAAVLAAQRDGAGLFAVPHRSPRLDAAPQLGGLPPGNSRGAPHHHMQWGAPKGDREGAAVARLQGTSPSCPFPPI